MLHNLSTIIFLVAALIFVGCRATEKYTPIESSGWAHMIAETRLYQENTLLYCGAACQAEPSCNCFVMVGNSCHLGSPGNQLTFLPDPNLFVDVYMKEGDPLLHC